MFSVPRNIDQKCYQAGYLNKNWQVWHFFQLNKTRAGTHKIKNLIVDEKHLCWSYPRTKLNVFASKLCKLVAEIVQNVKNLTALI